MAGFLITVCLLWSAGPIAGLSDQIIPAATLYSTITLLNITGTPTGILRLFDKFGLYAAQQVSGAAIKLVAVIWVSSIGGSIEHYLAAWGAGQVGATVVLVCLAVVTMRKQGVALRKPSDRKERRELFRFAFWTNITSAFDLPVKQLDIIIVSQVISMDATGVYKIVKESGQLIGKVADPLHQAIYPDLARMVNVKGLSEAIRLVKKSAFALASFGFPAATVAGVTASFWLVHFFGPEFAVGAAPVAVFLVLKAASVTVIGVHPLFLSLGYARDAAMILLLSNVLYLATVVALGSILGLMGVVLAYGIQFVTTVVLKIVIIGSRNRSIAPMQSV